MIRNMKDRKVYCVICCKIYKTLQKGYTPHKHHYVCNSCMSNKITIFSSTECKKRFLLKNKDLKGIKTIYSCDTVNKVTSKHYLLFQIINLLKKKHYSLRNFGRYLIKQKKTTTKKRTNKKIKQNNRLKEIKENFKDYRLPFHFHGNVYSYVKYGKPSMEKVIKLEIKKQNKICKKINNLNKHLKSYGLKYDKNIKACYDYVHCLGHKKTISEIIREIEIESFYRKETEYLNYLKYYTEKKAKHLSLKEYMKVNNKPGYIKPEFTIYFD